LRAGHRAEPVACRCRCRHRRARSFALHRSLVQRVHAESRFAAGTHRPSTPPSSQGLAFLWPGVV
jgi:hypothetical protein